MSTKSITIEEDAYEMLKSWKSENESFSDVVRKLVGRAKLTDFIGILGSRSGERLERVIAEGRKASKARLLRRINKCC